MAKPGRNDRCPCGSGKKYKACCLTKDEAAEREELAKAQAARDSQAAEKRQSLREVREAMLAKLAGADEVVSETRLQHEDNDDQLTTASNAVLDLIRDNKLDEAEAAASDLLVRYPEVPDGWDRLGMVHEKRGRNREAADCYRKLIAFVREHPDDFGAEIVEEYAARVTKLDPPAAG
jgi:tetratricopeptide (TPR) repeat protein